MTTLMLPLLALAFQQAPQPTRAPARTPSAARQPAQQQGAGMQRAAAPRTPFDSTVAALTDVGTHVADVRSTYELYRRAVFNLPDGAILERAEMYRNSCRGLAETARLAQRTICRTCVAEHVRASLRAYAANLPSVVRMADQCSARMARLRRGADAAAAEAMRADIRAEGERLVVGLRPYEARLAVVRREMGWDTPRILPTPRPGN